MERILKSAWLGVILGFVLSFLAVWQEAHLDGTGFEAVVLGVVISYIVGLLANAFVLVMGGGFKLKRTLVWLISGIIGSVIACVIF